MSGLSWFGSLRAGVGRADAERDLVVARRLGHWFTDEDRQFLREHRAEQFRERQSAALQKLSRVSTVGLLTAAWAVPPLWPVAVVASFRVFPRTSRRLLLGVLGVTGATLVGSGMVVHQVVQSTLAPPVQAPSALPSAPFPADQSIAP